MSLLSQAMKDCVMILKTSRPDGYGGYVTRYVEDTEVFKAAIVFDNSIQARIAGAQGVTSLYTITTGREKVLMYHDIIKRLSDGKILRITSDGDDKETPPSSSLNMRQVTAEEYTLPR